MTRKNNDHPSSPAGEGLASLVEASAAGARVLYIGDGVGLPRIARAAERVLHLEVGETVDVPSLPNVQRRKLKPGRIAFRPGSFDLVVAPDLTRVPGHPEDVLYDLAEVADGGLLAVGVPFEGRDAYEEFVEIVDEILEAARIFGVDGFRGLRVSELGFEDEELFVSTREVTGAPSHVFAVAGAYDEVPTSVLVELEPQPEGVDVRALRALEAQLEKAVADAEDVERELVAERKRAAQIDDRVRELEAAAAKHAREIEKLTEKYEREIQKLGEKLEREKGRRAELEELEAERKVLESRLEARGEELKELRTEVERRGVIVRDLVEELRELRRRGTGGSEQARERALRAEAKAEAAILEADELRARVYELEEERDRLRAVAATQAVAAEAQTPEATLPPEIAEALGERDGLRLRVAHLEAALEALRARDTSAVARPDRGKEEELERLRAELMETRAGAEAKQHALDAQGDLVRRLQRDLAATEVALRAAEERCDHDGAEIARLRDALVEAVAQGDRAAAELAAAQSALAARAPSEDLGDVRAELERAREELAQMREELERTRDELERTRVGEASALESAEAARRALVEAKAALVELEAKAASRGVQND